MRLIYLLENKDLLTNSLMMTRLNAKAVAEPQLLGEMTWPLD
jgi:hypothetical protein